MTTASEQQIGTTAAANETIRRTIRALRSAHDVDVRELAAHVGMSRGSFYNRMNGTAPFIGGELVVLADYFGVTVQDICDGNVHINTDSAAARAVWVQTPGTRRATGRTTCR